MRQNGSVRGCDRASECFDSLLALGVVYLGHILETRMLDLVCM